MACPISAHSGSGHEDRGWTLAAAGSRPFGGDVQNGCRVWWSRLEAGSRHRATLAADEVPSTRPRSATGRHVGHQVTWQQQICGLQSAAGRCEHPDDRLSQRPRRICDHSERSRRQPEVQQVELEHSHCIEACEPASEQPDAMLMQFDRQHPSTGGDQCRGDDAVSGAKINNELPGAYAGGRDELAGPLRAQPVPSPEALLYRGLRPSLPCPGHDAP